MLKQIIRLIMTARRLGGVKMMQQAPQQFALFKRLMTDPRVPAPAKAVLVGAVGFAVSPLNIPNYIPIVGALDDIGIVLLAGNFFLKQVPAEVMAEHRRAVGLADNDL